MKYFFLLITFFFISVQAIAQTGDDQTSDIEGEIVTVSDSASNEAYVDTLGVGFWRKLLAPTYPNPERAAALSFILPGAGQVYNKKFWYIKVPVIYGGYAFLIQRAQSNRDLQKRYRTAYLLSLENLPHEFSGTVQDSPGALRIRRDLYSKNYQLSYIGVVILHFVQTLEAYTTGHLLQFDMDESLTISPTLIPGDPMGFGGSRPGVTIGFQLGR